MNFEENRYLKINLTYGEHKPEKLFSIPCGQYEPKGQASFGEEGEQCSHVENVIVR